MQRASEENLDGPRGSPQLPIKNPQPEGSPLKTIFLLRHAKSSWDEPYMDDYQRPLAPRGIKAAPRMGRYMFREGLIPQRVLCSGARRTRETWELVSAPLKVEIPVEYVPDIYHGSSVTIKDLIGHLSDIESSVLFVGHNPIFHQLALTLAGSGDEAAIQQLQFKYPTGALAILDFDTEHWSAIRDGTGYLRAFIRPKELKNR
jgi:phosphohistidine phosphatase